MLYFVSWGCSEGGNRITNDSEQIFYSVLDVLSQGLFTIALLALTRRLDLDKLGLSAHEEKRMHGGTTTGGAGNGIGNGVGNGIGNGNGVGNEYHQGGVF